MAQSQFDRNRQEITPREVENLMELWMQRTGGHQPSIVDMAGALNTTPDEVARMLGQIRGQSQHANRGRVLAQSLKWLAIGALAVFMMFALAGVGYMAGLREGRRFGGYSGSFGSSYSLPPLHYTVGFDGYSIPGGRSSYTEPILTQRVLEDNLRRAIGAMSPHGGPVVGDLEQVRSAIAKDQDIDGVIAFRDGYVQYLERKIHAKIPVCLTSNSTIRQVIEDEQERRIKQLVSAIIPAESFGVDEIARPKPPKARS